MKTISPLRIWAILAKEFTQLRRDRITYAMILLIPILDLALFGYVVNNDPHHLPAAVLSHDHSAMANSVVSAMEQTTYVDIKYKPESEDELDRLIKQGKIQLSLTIPPDFTQRVLKHDGAQILVEADASDPTSAAAALNAVTALPSNALIRELKGAIAPPSETPPFEVIIHRLYNPENITSYNIVPGLLGVILSMTLVMMTAMAVTREVERGTLETLLATPASPMELMVGKLIPYVIVGIVQSIVIIGIAAILFNVPMARTFDGWVCLSLGVLIFITGNLSLGYLFSTLAKNQLQAMQMSAFYMLPSMFLSGFIFPFYGMPKWAQAIGEVLPVTHFLRIVRGALLKEQVTADLTHNFLILSLFVIIVGAISVYQSRTTLD